MDAVTEAFRAEPRTGFLPEALRRRAPYDGPLDIPHRHTNSQPRTHKRILRLLDETPRHPLQQKTNTYN